MLSDFVFLCCGGWDRTTDLQVMSLTSYHCSTPRHYHPVEKLFLCPLSEPILRTIPIEMRCKGTAKDWYVQINSPFFYEKTILSCISVANIVILHAILCRYAVCVMCLTRCFIRGVRS